MAERLGQNQASPPRTESDPCMETNVLLRKHSPSKNIRVQQIRFNDRFRFERHGQTRDCPHPTEGDPHTRVRRSLAATFMYNKFSFSVSVI